MSNTDSTRGTAAAGVERLIDGKTLGLLYLTPDYLSPPTGWRGIWRRHVIANAALRDRPYMEALFREYFPTGRLAILESARIPAGTVDDEGNVVLLYADAIGIDWRRIEREIISSRSFRRVLALNGRRRLLLLNPATRRRLARRRFLEKSRLLEITFLSLFLVGTPVLALLDLVRGRR